jgi:hypothetical protein
MKPGDKVSWHYETTRGWGIDMWVPATVVKVTSKRVTIDAELQNGGTARRSVRPDNLKLKESVNEQKQAWLHTMATSEGYECSICGKHGPVCVCGSHCYEHCQCTPDDLPA